MIRYFLVEVEDLTNDIIEKSGHMNNPYFLRRSVNGTQVILKCHCNSVSVDLFKLGAVPMTSEEIISYIDNPDNGFSEDASIEEEEV